MQRAAQEGHGAPYGLATGQAGNGLVDHRLKNGGGQVCPGGALVNQGLNVGFGKHAAPGGNGIDLLVALCRVVQARGVGLQKGRHLVDKGAGAAGADAVHPLLQTALKIDDFRVLAAQFDGHIGLRGNAFQGGGNRHDLLNKAD